MGSRSKSNFRDYNHYFKVEETWLYRDVGTSFIVEPFKVRTAVYETRTYGGVRGALRQLSWRSRLLNYRAFLLLNCLFLSFIRVFSFLKTLPLSYISSISVFLGN